MYNKKLGKEYTHFLFFFFFCVFQLFFSYVGYPFSHCFNLGPNCLIDFLELSNPWSHCEFKYSVKTQSPKTSNHSFLKKVKCNLSPSFRGKKKKKKLLVFSNNNLPFFLLLFKGRYWINTNHLSLYISFSPEFSFNQWQWYWHKTFNILNAIFLFLTSKILEY